MDIEALIKREAVDDPAKALALRYVYEFYSGYDRDTLLEFRKSATKDVCIVVISELLKEAEGGASENT